MRINIGNNEYDSILLIFHFIADIWLERGLLGFVVHKYTRTLGKKLYSIRQIWHDIITIQYAHFFHPIHNLAIGFKTAQYCVLRILCH